jgi:hypothetical protein
MTQIINNKLNYRIKSQPQKVRFAGFESDTLKLQRSGWQLAVEEDYHYGKVSLVGRHREFDLNFMSISANYNAYAINPQDIIFHVQYCRSQMVLQLMADMSNFKLIDATPTYCAVTDANFKDLSLWNTPLVRTKEIIVDPKDVAECLEIIQRLQAPELARIRESNRRDELRKQDVFHAQILSIA